MFSFRNSYEKVDLMNKEQLGMSAKIRKRREKLWKEVSGKCFWCGVDTVMPERGKHDALPVENLATIDHLRTRLHKEERSKPNKNNEERTVLACWVCNNLRGILDQKTMEIFTATYTERLK
jgi:hypothetical protein